MTTKKCPLSIPCIHRAVVASITLLGEETETVPGTCDPRVGLYEKKNIFSPLTLNITCQTWFQLIYVDCSTHSSLIENTNMKIGRYVHIHT